MKELSFFTDAETDGLYGRFLSVAAAVTDKTGKETDSFYAAVNTEIDSISTPWVRENVYPYLKNAYSFFDDEYQLLEAFWSFWLKYRDTADCIAHVQHPVESRLFTSCVMHDLATRQLLAPFPLYDLSTLLAAKGLDFDSDMNELSGISCACHDALNDVRMTAAVWHSLMNQ